MEITLRIPDEFVALLKTSANDLPRRALESLAIQGYREGSLTRFQVGRLLSLSRTETEDFLAQCVDLYDYDPSELDREARALERLPDETG
jgi:predicted HTH domain antitoxin